MTERKPPQKSWSSYIEEQIRQAQADGEFDRLEGRGKRIPGIDAPYDPLWWVKKLLEREKLSVLPPALAIRAAVDRGMEDVWNAPDEAGVRRRVAALNGAIARANRTTAEGPPTSLSPLDVESVLAEWRRRRAGP